MKDKRCDGCVFWAKNSAPSNAHRDDREGWCHRYAPRPTSSDWPHEVLTALVKIAWGDLDAPELGGLKNTWEEASVTGITYWPMTTGADWCGEFERAP